MREVKFRAWDEKNKRYADDYSEVVINSDGGVCRFESCNYDHVLIPEKYIIEQFTGLNDKNGKPIFEGDVVRIYGDKEEISEIAFEDGCFCQKENSELYIFNKFCEIIGNIHENKELLNG